MRLNPPQRIFVTNLLVFGFGFCFGLIVSSHFIYAQTLIKTPHKENNATSYATDACTCPSSVETNNRSTSPVQTTVPQATVSQVVDSIHSKYDSIKLDAALAKNRTLLATKVTVISYCSDEQAYDSLNSFASSYPSTRVLLASAKGSKRGSAFNYTGDIYHIGEFESKGDALNKLIETVETDYFLHLDSYHNVSDPSSDQSVGWLLDYWLLVGRGRKEKLGDR